MLRQKVKSNTGASLAMALLLFLICAVLGALVLTAGSAAAGRFSKLAEQDQAYYKVSSAAELLMTELDGAKVEIARYRQTTTVTTAEFTVNEETGLDEPAGVPTTSSPSFAYRTALNGAFIGSDASYVTAASGTALPDTLSFLSDLAARMLFGDSACNTADAWALNLRTNGYTRTGSFTLEPAYTGMTGSLDVKCDYELKPGGMLYITVSDTVSDEGSRFSMTLILAAELTDGPVLPGGNSSTTETSTGTSGKVVTTTDVVTETRTSTAKWTVRSVA